MITRLRFAASAGLLALVAACASVKQPVALDNGDWLIDCSDGTPGWTTCHGRAESLCDGSYDVRSRVSNEGSSGVGYKDWSKEGSVITRAFVIACKNTIKES